MKHIKLFENFQMDNENIQLNFEDEISSIVDSSPETIMFQTPQELDADGISWSIHGIQPDKIHGDLKILYSDDDSSPVKEVDFFDFHPEVHQKLLDLIKGNM
jgi:hypothetical protein